MNEENKAKVTSVLSAKETCFESAIAIACSLPEDEVRAILKSDRHRFRRTGFLRLTIPFDRQWTLTRIFRAEQFGRKTAPRVR